MKRKVDFNKDEVAAPGGAADRPSWRVDFHRLDATAEVSQWAHELGESRVREGTPPLFILNEADKDTALEEFEELEPEATLIDPKPKG